MTRLPWCHRYDLCSVVNHYGGAGGGHYTAYVNNGTGPTPRWLHFDDQRVTEVRTCVGLAVVGLECVVTCFEVCAGA